jgi:colanic acid biosynthesis glycosyl transferase WcaI
MDKRRVLLIGGNYFPEPTGIGKYSGEMMQWLAEQGHDCTVVTTFPYYPEWKVQEPYARRRYWYKIELLPVGDRAIKVYRCPHYVPQRPSGLTRLISEFSFFISAHIIVLLLIFKKKYDYIITIAPPFELGLLGVFYKKMRGAKFLYHIQDLQIDAAWELQIIKNKTLINLFLSVERFILRHSDCTSSISEGMIKKVKEKCSKDVCFFPNWVDVNAFRPLPNRNKLKSDYGFGHSDKIVLYSGSIGKKQGLDVILYAAKTIEKYEDFKFVICGAGPYKEQLEKLKEELNLKNVFFMPLQTSITFNSFLNMADIHLVLQKAGASDLVLPSKLCTILSIGGVAIVTANEGTSLHSIINSCDMGVLIEPESPAALSHAIHTTLNNGIDKKRENARRYAEHYLSSNKILTDFFEGMFTPIHGTTKVVERKVVITNN